MSVKVVGFYIAKNLFQTYVLSTTENRSCSILGGLISHLN